ncbi:MAG: type III pantothenate kinase [Bacteroidota bacterium]|nr:type III pantothenate kinase [Bacteroidota bacterium]
MWLTLDIGNSGVKAGLFDGPRLVSHQAWPVEAPFESDLLPWFSQYSIDRAGLCSVGPRRPHSWLGWGRRIPVLILSHTLRLPLEIEYTRPELLGTDRIAAAAGAWVQFGRTAPVVIVDAGTTVTIDLVHNGVFLGGTIAPGPALMRNALSDGTASLPSVELKVPAGAYGTDTTSAIQQGVMLGFIDMVTGAIQRASDALPAPPVVVCTGGLHKLLVDQIAAIDHLMPHLVLRGIREIMRLNP